MGDQEQKINNPLENIKFDLNAYKANTEIINKICSLPQGQFLKEYYATEGKDSGNKYHASATYYRGVIISPGVKSISTIDKNNNQIDVTVVSLGHPYYRSGIVTRDKDGFYNYRYFSRASETYDCLVLAPTGTELNVDSLLPYFANILQSYKKDAKQLYRKKEITYIDKDASNTTILLNIHGHKIETDADGIKELNSTPDLTPGKFVFNEGDTLRLSIRSSHEVSKLFNIHFIPYGDLGLAK